MKLYKLSFTEKNDNEHKGFAFYSSQREAKKEARKVASHKDCEIEAIVVTPTKAGILRALNRYAGHPDNG